MENVWVTRIVYPDYIRWLDEESIRGLVVTNSRNNVVCAGGMIRCLKESDYFSRTDTVLLRAALESPEEWNEKESVWGNIEVKFEELKCNPQSVIKKIGDGIGISFDNLLDHTIYNGEIAYQNIEKIIKPVYNPYEEFLSQFDKMRIAILSSEWQKKRGYPYIDIMDITRKDLQEMFLREFRFEKDILFGNQEEYLRYRQSRQRWLWRQLLALRFRVTMKE